MGPKIVEGDNKKSKYLTIQPNFLARPLRGGGGLKAGPPDNHLRSKPSPIMKYKKCFLYLLPFYATQIIL
jgi:hypothetical protein